MKCLLRRTLAGFAAEDEAAQAVANRTQIGDMVRADMTVPRDQRSLKQHNLYFAVLKHVWQNLPEKYSAEIPTPKVLRKRIFHEIDFVETIVTRKGPREEARSLEFAQLGQAEFHERVWTPTMRLIDQMAPGLGEAFEREYLEMVS